MDKLRLGLDKVEKAIDLVIGILTLVLLLLLFIQVVNRYILGISWPMLQFIVSLSFVWLCMLGAAVAVRRRLHFEVDMLAWLLSPRGRHWHGVAVTLSMFLGGAILVWTGWGFIELGMLKKNPATGYSMVYIYSALFGGGFLICVLALEQAMIHIVSARNQGGAAA